jgi:signal transduction histidine kinase
MSNISILKKELSHKIAKLNRSSDNIEINKIVEELITKVTDTEFASLWIYNFPMLSRIRDGKTKEISIEEKNGLIYECFAKKQAVIYNYLSSEKGYVPSVDNPDNIKIKSKIMIPLIDNDTFIGIATAYSSIKKIKKFTNDDLKILQAVAPFIIESIYKIKNNTANSSSNKRDMNYIPKRANDEVTQNLNNNLDKLEKSLSDTKAPNEMLEYMSNIVHDIRTPANGLLGFLEILQEQIDDKRLKEYVGHAKDSALLINELTTSILDGVSQKREPLNKEPKTIDTIKFFSNIAEMFSANMANKNIYYNIFIDPLLPKEIKLDSMKTKRVIMNLISNASKFTPENGLIEFSVRYKQKEKKLHIFIKDNGIGIAQDKQDEIFEAFKQAEDNTKDIYGGTGLGLAICAGYVKDMNSKLLLDSKLNHGSTFYFDLPMEIEEYPHQLEVLKNTNLKISILMNKYNSFVANHIARYLVKIGVNVDNISAITDLKQLSNDTTHIVSFEDKLSGELFSFVQQNSIKLLVIEERFLSLEESNLDGAMLVSQYRYFGDSLYNFISKKDIPRVLIVEDDNISIVLIKSMLENEYCEIDVATNGKDGLDLLNMALNNSNPYNIVYTDHNMPQLSGAQMLEEYKKLEEKTCFNKTITVSISGDVRNKEEYSYDYYATKPFKKKEIISLFLNTTK